MFRFLQSEPKEQWEATMGPLNVKIQLTSLELLHAILARGDIDQLSLEALEPIIIGKLYYGLHLRRADLQSKLLRILHSLLSASTAHVTHSNASHNEEHDGSSEADVRAYSINPLLMQTLVDGISLPHNRGMLQHWLDFVLVAIPQFQPVLQALVCPMVDCLGRQLRLFVTDVLRARRSDPGNTVLGVATDAEFIMLLNALERLLILGLANHAEPSQQEEDLVLQEKSGHESSGILGYVSNVFTLDSPTTQTDEQPTVGPMSSISTHHH